MFPCRRTYPPPDTVSTSCWVGDVRYRLSDRPSPPHRPPDSATPVRDRPTQPRERTHPTRSATRNSMDATRRSRNAAHLRHRSRNLGAMGVTPRLPVPAPRRVRPRSPPPIRDMPHRRCRQRPRIHRRQNPLPKGSRHRPVPADACLRAERCHRPRGHGVHAFRPTVDRRSHPSQRSAVPRSSSQNSRICRNTRLGIKFRGHKPGLPPAGRSHCRPIRDRAPASTPSRSRMGRMGHLPSGGIIIP